jgi:hypothetical protein
VLYGVRNEAKFVDCWPGRERWQVKIKMPTIPFNSDRVEVGTAWGRHAECSVMAQIGDLLFHEVK